MNKKLLILIIIALFAFAGCEKVDTTTNNITKISNRSTETPTHKPMPASEPVIDYNQYTQKVWVTSFDYGSHGYYYSFCITKISDGKLTGYFNEYEPMAADCYSNYADLGHLSGVISGNKAECTIKDPTGDRGNITLYFKRNNIINVTTEFVHNPELGQADLVDGTYDFRTYNLNDTKDEYSIIKDQSFNVNLNSWGNIRFVSAKSIYKDSPAVFYITDDAGNILCSLEPHSYSVTDVKAVTFRDVNKDGLKDIVVVGTSTGNGKSEPSADVLIQDTDGRFIIDYDLNDSIYNSGHSKSIKDVLDYLATIRINTLTFNSEDSDRILNMFVYGKWEIKRTVLYKRAGVSNNSSNSKNEEDIIGKKIEFYKDKIISDSCTYSDISYQIRKMSNSNDFSVFYDDERELDIRDDCSYSIVVSNIHTGSDYIGDKFYAKDNNTLIMRYKDMHYELDRIN